VKKIDDLIAVLTKERNDLIQFEKKIKLQEEEFLREKTSLQAIVNPTDRVQLIVGGVKFETRVETLLKVPNTEFTKLFSGSYSGLVQRNNEGVYVLNLDFNPKLFAYLLEQYRRLKPNEQPNFRPPLIPNSADSYNKMLQKLGIPLPEKSAKDIIALNVGGEKVATLREVLTGVTNSKLARFASNRKDLERDRIGRPFVDYDPSLFRFLLAQLKEGKKINEANLRLPAKENQKTFLAMVNDLKKTENL